MNIQRFATLFPLGSHLCREPMPPMAELKRDMEILKGQGFNLIKLQEHWAIDEPVEGRYDFSRYEELIAHAASLDMGVYLGLTCEQAPVWLWRKHPDCAMVGRNGVTIPYIAATTLPADGKPGPCFDHPGAMADQVRFIRRLVETLGRFENVVVWNTWQEIGYWSDGLVGTGVCFCEHTLTAFQRWLQEYYGDLDDVNRAWNTRYGAWKDILPDRSHGRIVLSAVNICWQYFMDNVQVAGVLRARALAIKEADPLGRPVFAHKGVPQIGAGQDWTYARCQDFMGSSCYPAWGSFEGWDDGRQGGGRLDRHAALLAEMWNNVGLRYEYIRSCNSAGSPVWAAEFQGGPVSTGFHKGRVPSAADIRRWMLTAVASGVTAVSFWVTRAEIMAAEVNGFSLLDSEGEETERLQEAGRVGRALNAHADLFGRPSLQPADVGILINEWNYQLCSLLAQGGGNLAYSVRGWHRLLWDLNIPVDFVEVAHLFEAPWDHYKALILPFPLSLSEGVAGQLARYVEMGGHLISEAAPGRIDEYGFCTRGEMSPAMRALFGVRQRSFTMVREPGDGARWSPGERTWGEYLEPAMLTGAGLLDGQQLRANVYLQTFTPDDGTPILQYGDQAAGVMRQAGKGQAWLLGTYAGHSGTAYRDPANHACIRALLAAVNVQPASAGRLLLRKRVAEGKEAWIFTNPYEETVEELVVISGWTQVEDLLGEQVKREGDIVKLMVPALDIRVLVLS